MNTLLPPPPLPQRLFLACEVNLSLGFNARQNERYKYRFHPSLRPTLNQTPIQMMFRQASRNFSTNVRMPSSYFLQTPRRLAMRWYVLNPSRADLLGAPSLG
ncbi:hypothetical protein LZ32DRAFT_601101 [Colletotrichum eremochloae]|nr:hypothetical protein LZ32DRAFT_601101 [Colletotrichum eremochloae]